MTTTKKNKRQFSKLYVYVFRTSGVKASEDTIVTDPNLEISGKKAEKQE